MSSRLLSQKSLWVGSVILVTTVSWFGCSDLESKSVKKSSRNTDSISTAEGEGQPKDVPISPADPLPLPIDLTVDQCSELKESGDSELEKFNRQDLATKNIEALQKKLAGLSLEFLAESNLHLVALGECGFGNEELESIKVRDSAGQEITALAGPFGDSPMEVVSGVDSKFLFEIGYGNQYFAPYGKQNGAYFGNSGFVDFPNLILKETSGKWFVGRVISKQKFVGEISTCSAISNIRDTGCRENVRRRAFLKIANKQNFGGVIDIDADFVGLKINSMFINID